MLEIPRSSIILFLKRFFINYIIMTPPDRPLPSSAFIPFDSFDAVRFISDPRRCAEIKAIQQELWTMEKESARYVIPYAEEYPPLVDQFNTRGQLSVRDAAFASTFEAACIFLADPFEDQFLNRTLWVYRSLRLLELSGKLRKESRTGNILLIGTADTLPEITAFDIDITVTDPTSIQRHGQEVLTRLDRCKPRQKPLFHGELIKASQELYQTLRIGRRINPQQQTIVAVEPNPVHINQYEMLMVKSTLRKAPHMVANITLGDFMHLSGPNIPSRFTLIASLRSEPMMWSDFDRINLTGLSADIRLLQQRIPTEILKKFLSDISGIIGCLQTSLDTRGQFLFSVGAGQDERVNDLTRRIALMGWLLTTLRAMGYTVLDQWSVNTREKFEHWPEHNASAEMCSLVTEPIRLKQESVIPLPRSGTIFPGDTLKQPVPAKPKGNRGKGRQRRRSGRRY
ncbi:hypothetical protein A2Y99_01775 [Candidatus Gottesmanbacteria bacterium RBG_13_37_7]|uniref:Uncharacterized protein n=1 Tax=Candidatus Gottesmanbacteria bacterium RBG_13_37_7 TaxID=1798369 RepID=A0A1F5YIR8_9BACT|nr:MAG: hypothetical protein A2Y99_01775 [Candidatus Gottesmanbacteria bacterium RBG_13_37_7]